MVTLKNQIENNISAESKTEGTNLPLKSLHEIQTQFKNLPVNVVKDYDGKVAQVFLKRPPTETELAKIESKILWLISNGKYGFEVGVSRTYQNDRTINMVCNLAGSNQ